MSKYRYHPAEFTSERLAKDEQRWHHRFTEAERDAIMTIRRGLRRISDEDERATGRQGFDAFAVVQAETRLNPGS